MLKAKIEVKYRQARVALDGRWRRCDKCRNRQFVPIKSCAVSEGSDNILRYDWRCEVIGVQSSRRYFVAADHVCEKFEQHQTKGETS